MREVPIIFADLISAAIVIFVWIRIYTNPALDPKAVRLFRNIGITLFVTLILDHIWEYFYSFGDITESTRQLLNTISSLEFLCLPVTFFFLLMYHRDHWDLGDSIALAANTGLLSLDILNIWIPIYSSTDQNLYMINTPSTGWVYLGTIILLGFILTHDFLMTYDNDFENRVMIFFTILIAALGAGGCYYDGDVVAVWECFSIVYLLLYLTLVRVFNKTDQVTGIPNRNAFTLNYFREKRKSATVLVSFDLNHLKHFNDESGHKTGDQYLRAFAQTAQKQLSSYGKLYRVGGDEFCLTSHLSSEHDTDRLKEALEKLSRMEKCDPAFGDFPMDFAYGIACRLPGESSEALYERADAIMYMNKRSMESGETRK